MVIHPALSPLLLILAYELTHEDYKATTPLAYAIRIAAGGSGPLLTLVMVIRARDFGIGRRIGLVVTTAVATVFAFYAAFYVFLLAFQVLYGPMG